MPFIQANVYEYALMAFKPPLLSITILLVLPPKANDFKSAYIILDRPQLASPAADDEDIPNDTIGVNPPVGFWAVVKSELTNIGFNRSCFFSSFFLSSFFSSFLSSFFSSLDSDLDSSFDSDLLSDLLSELLSLFVSLLDPELSELEPDEDDSVEDDDDWEEDDEPDEVEDWDVEPVEVDAADAEDDAALDALDDAEEDADDAAVLAAEDAADEAALAADDAAAEAAVEAAWETVAVIVCCTAVFVGHGIENISLIHLVTVPEAKSAYVNVLDLFLISTTTPGWFDAIGTNTV